MKTLNLIVMVDDIECVDGQPELTGPYIKVIFKNNFGYIYTTNTEKLIHSYMYIVLYNYYSLSRRECCEVVAQDLFVREMQL